MQKLHLVGFTTDHRGLIFSVRRGAKSGSYVVAVDDRLLESIDDIRDALEELAAAGAAHHEPPAATRPESRLTVREMQSRLRRGRTIHEVAKAAGVDESWVARFAVPVFAEQAEIVRTVRAARFTRARVGASAAPLGESVYRNLADRGVNDPRTELDEKWRARQVRDGVWQVSFGHSWRGRRHELVWELDEATGAVRARDRLAAQLAYRPGPTRPASPRPASPRPAAGRTRVASETGTPARTPTRRPASTAPRDGGTRRRTDDTTKRVGAARRAATARMMSEADKATRRNAALARKAAARPVRRFPVAATNGPGADATPATRTEPPALEGEPVAVAAASVTDPRPSVEIHVEPPAEVDAAPTVDVEVAVGDGAANDGAANDAAANDAAATTGAPHEPEAPPSTDVAVDRPARARSARELLDELEQLLPPPRAPVVEVSPERAPADVVARPRRREPLRAARAPSPEPAAVNGGARRRLRVGPTSVIVETTNATTAANGNGAVIRADRARPAGSRHRSPTPDDERTPVPAASEPRPGSRRRPLRGR